MKTKEFIGIDVSKLFIDVGLHLSQVSSKFDNDPRGISRMIQWCERQSGLKKQELFFVFEHTGLYSYELSRELSNLEVSYSIQAGLAVKRSLGITRGKNDRIDAIKLARYAYRLRDELTPYRPADKQIQRLQSLLTLRDRMVKQRSGYKASLKEQKRVLEATDYQFLFDTQKQLISQISEHIKETEKQIRAIINECDVFSSLASL